MKAALIPVFAEVALTFGLVAALARARVAAVKGGVVKMKDIALRQDAWPDPIRKVGASYQSQLELPILFYALIAFAIATAKLDVVTTAGAWCFVVARFGHAYIHITTNYVPTRFRLFAAGGIVLALMWAYFALRVLFD